MGNDFRVYCIVKNLRTKESELDFGDFKVISVRQGPEVVEWRKKLHCKDSPRNILIKDFSSYEQDEADRSDYDVIINTIDRMLLLLRLYKVGDIMFGDFLIESHSSNNSSIGKYSAVSPSAFKYCFSADEIFDFNDFRNRITNKVGFTNPFYRFASGYFMQGVNKEFEYRINILEIQLLNFLALTIDLYFSVSNDAVNIH